MIKRLSAIAYRNRLKDYTLIKIKSWNCFLVDTKSGQRETIKFL